MDQDFFPQQFYFNFILCDSHFCRFQPDSCSLDGAAEQELSIHDGTVRDVLFLDDPRGNAVLVTAGAGDCRIHVTDTATATVVQSMAGHSNHVLSLCTWSAG